MNEDDTLLPEDQSSYSDTSEKSLEEISVPITKKKIQSNMPLIAVIIFVFIYIAPILSLHPTAHTCLAMLCTICFLWITETIPPFATSYLIPIISVWLQIGIDKETGKRISSPDLAQFFAFRFMDPIILVFFGSLVLSTALQKLNITSRVSRFILAKVTPPTPSRILLVLMLINLGIGSLLSNVASTTLTLSLALPIIKSLKPSDPFIKALLFGIAWSGNNGGQPTTIASPQNVIAVHTVDTIGSPISFIGWIFFGTPVSLLLLIAQWYYLTNIFSISKTETLNLVQNMDLEAPWSIQHSQAVIVTIITIFMWSLGDSFKWFMGHIGIASLIPIVWFFGSGILNANDFNSLKWTTLSLLGGGLALGEAMKISGLLDCIAESAKQYLEGVSAWSLLVILLVIEGCLASLLSSTTAASIMFPLITAVGSGTGHAPMLVVLSALMISSAQLFHISSFPNALCSGVCVEGATKEDEKECGIENGTPFLRGIDYVKYGWPTVALSVSTIATLGYFLASKLGY